METIISLKRQAQLAVACRRRGPALWRGRGTVPYTARRIHTSGKVTGERTGGPSVKTGMLRPQDAMPLLSLSSVTSRPDETDGQCR